MLRGAWHFAALFTLVAAAAAPVLARPWTNRAGKTIEADFVRLEGDKVVLLVGGKETFVALDQLSDADQQFAREQAAAPAPAPIPDITKRRKWTDLAGDSMSAGFAGIEREQVVFVDGRQTRRVPFTNLCEADQDLICRFLESRGLGLSIPPRELDIPQQASRVWTDRTGRAAQGILRQIEPEGQIVLQMARTTARLPFDNFGNSDQQLLRKVAEEVGLEANLPTDPNLRTWRDWLGNEFIARLDPDLKPRFIHRRLQFVTTDKERISKDFTELDQADRDFVLKLAQAAGGGQFLESFSEPTTSARAWTSNGAAQSVLAKFVTMENGQAVLRTATNHAERHQLASLAPADRQYIREEMRRRGQEQLVLLVREDCREWIYGPAGIGNVLVAQLDGVAGGAVRFRLPDPSYARETEGKTAELSFLALSPADQEYVLTQLRLDPSSLLPAGGPGALTTRDWKIDGGRQALRGTLQYITPTEIFIGDAQNHRPVSFAQLSADDQAYICLMLAANGQARFDRPPPPPPRQQSGVVRYDSAPQSGGYVSPPQRRSVNSYQQPRSRSFSAYQAGQFCGGFTCFCVLVMLVIFLVTRLSQ